MGERGRERGRGPAHSLPSLRRDRSRLSRLPGDEGRGGAEPSARRGRRREVRAAGAGELWGGQRGHARARARPRLRRRSAPGRVCDWERARARSGGARRERC